MTRFALDHLHSEKGKTFSKRECCFDREKINIYTNHLFKMFSLRLKVVGAIYLIDI